MSTKNSFGDKWSLYAIPWLDPELRPKAAAQALRGFSDVALDLVYSCLPDQLFPQVARNPLRTRGVDFFYSVCFLTPPQTPLLLSIHTPSLRPKTNFHLLLNHSSKTQQRIKGPKALCWLPQKPRGPQRKARLCPRGLSPASLLSELLV